ncbi:MAG: flagellar biosynthetic protein FliR [Acidobacteria bacterium]|nr:flagellar biosynthetic protein FliR [Acidobacteriota bacterium]
MDFLQHFTTMSDAFSLAFARVSGFIAFAPILGARTLPALVKAMMAFLLASVVAPGVQPLVRPEYLGNQWVWVILLEASIGAAIGLAASFVFEVVAFAGNLIDYQVGFGFINVVDPLFGTNVSILSFFYSLLASIVFLLVNAHHILIETVYRSYELLPIAGFQMSSFSLELLVRETSNIFDLGFRLAAPITLIMVILDFSFGMLGKTVPQFQILVIGFPLKVGFGLVALGLALKPATQFMMNLFAHYREQLFWILKSWGG